MYSSHQITIPPNLPTILKKYAKAAIRTQPKDLLVWTASYFKALSYGIPVPVKERLEYPPVKTISGLTPGYLKILINQLGNSAVVVLRSEVIDYWNGICLSKESLEEIFAVGGFGLKLNSLKFISICAGYMEPNLTRTMILLCNLLTEEPAGGSAHIPLHKFLYIYKYLARLDCGPQPPEKPKFKRLEEDINAIGEALSLENVNYKDVEEESTKTLSQVSWQSVLKRMGRRESDVTVATEVKQEGAKDDTLSRGIAWQRITEIAESEPDTSDTMATITECQDSNVGLQVFEYLEDQKLKKKVIDPNKTVEEKKELEVEWEDDGKISRSESLIDVNDLGRKSFEEIIKLAQDFETAKNVDEVGAAIEYDDEKQASPPQPSSPQPTEMDIITDKMDTEIHVLVPVDSSTILVPTPPGYSEDEGQDDYDIKELSEEDESQVGAPLAARIGTHSLHDVHVPHIDIPALINLEDEIPRINVEDQKWVRIPGIGSRVSEEQIKEVENYMKDCAEKQAGTVMPRNIRHFLCPPLDPPREGIKQYIPRNRRQFECPVVELPSEENIKYIKIP